jgi:hypothetical protein
VAKKGLTMLSRLGIAALAFGAFVATIPSGGALAQGAAAPPAVAALAGGWDLTSQNGQRKCRLTLRTNEAKGGRAIGFPPTCRRTLPALARVAAWSVSADGFVALNDADGKPVLAFEDDAAALKLKASLDGVDYQMDALGRSRRFVERPLAPLPPRASFDPARAPPRESIPGLYGVARGDGVEICRINLGTDPGAADGRFLARFPVRCRDRGLQVFDAVAWRYTGGRIHLIARRGHEMSLVNVGAGEWRKDPPGGSELFLKRVAN